MEGTDARPPPRVCELIAQVLAVSPDSRDLREFADNHPDDFVLLLLHAETCPTCRQMISQAYPDGFVTEDEAKSLDEGLADAEQLLRRDLAERDSSRNPPETESPGSEPRGDG